MIANLCFYGLLGLVACLGLGLWLGTREKKKFHCYITIKHPDGMAEVVNFKLYDFNHIPKNLFKTQRIKLRDIGKEATR